MLQWARMTAASRAGDNCWDRATYRTETTHCPSVPVRSASIRPIAFRPGKAGRPGRPGRRQNRGPAPLAAAVRPLLCLEGGQVAGCREAGLGRGEQRPVVALQPQRVLRLGRQHRLGHRRMAVQRVRCHRTALQGQPLQQIQCALHLRPSRRPGAGDGQPRLGIPHAHHQGRQIRLPLLVSAPQGLAVDRDHPTRRRQAELLPQRRHERRERPFQLRRIEQAERLG